LISAAGAISTRFTVRAPDLHAEDVGGPVERVVGGRGELHPAGLAATAGLDLGLHDHRGTDLLGAGSRLVGSLRDHSDGDGDAVPGEELLRLVFHEVHAEFPLVEIRAVSVWEAEWELSE